VASLTGSSHSDATRWANGLTNHQLRGLVHEVGQRLLNESQLYHARLAQLERLGENENYRFFGLDADATEKDLDNAYRKLARQWHPDKNGGTDEAKKRFQNMKERYEALKKKRGESSEKDDKGRGEKSKKGRNRDKSEENDDSPKNSNDEDEEEQRSAKSEGQEDDEEEEQTPDDDGPRLCILDGDKPSPQKEREREKTAVDSDDEDAGEEDDSPKEEDEEQQKSTSIEYDPSDKDSMVRTVSRMVKQLKNIEVQMKVLVKELGRAQRSAT
jgi:curved DNA-binding protein CbpA